MNILLLEHEQINNSLATVSGEKARHISNILKLKVGDSLRVGIINGKIVLMVFLFRGWFMIKMKTI